MIIDPLPTTDYLTGLNNRREFFKLSGFEFEKSVRHKGHLSVLYFRIDNFNHISNKYGYDMADALQIDFAKMLTGSCRKYDISGRLDGGEFALLLPREHVSTAANIAEKLLKKTHTLALPLKNGHLEFTVSIGCVEFDGDPSFDALMKRAEAQVFQAIKDGGNRVACAPGPAET